MILGSYAKTPDRAWLKSTLPAIEAYYRFWTTGEHAVADTGLSRYWDFGEGPAPEVVSDERDERGRTHYDRVREYYRTQQVTDYDLSQVLRPRTRRTDAALLQGGSLDAGIRVRSFEPVRPVQRRHHSLRTCLPQLVAVSDGARYGRNPVNSRRSAGRAARGAIARPAARIGSTRCCGTRRPVSTSTTTFRRSAAESTSSRRRSIRSGRGSPARSRRHACARISRNSKRQGEF